MRSVLQGSRPSCDHLVIFCHSYSEHDKRYSARQHPVKRLGADYETRPLSRHKRTSIGYKMMLPTALSSTHTRIKSALSQNMNGIKMMLERESSTEWLADAGDQIINYHKVRVI